MKLTPIFFVCLVVVAVSLAKRSPKITCVCDPHCNRKETCKTRGACYTSYTMNGQDVMVVRGCVKSKRVADICQNSMMMDMSCCFDDRCNQIHTDNPSEGDDDTRSSSESNSSENRSRDEEAD
ncbi:uncharacterized protein [Ptychodera flava]|uniref:uncharacterized protein n=1 Tax=Ptychodera flava TaxID=63121 RepID=UPI00396AAE45